MIGDNLELLEEVTSNSDNIAEGEMVHVSDGSEYGTRGLTADGVEGLQQLLADIRTWDGGIRQFLMDAWTSNAILKSLSASWPTS